MYAHAHVCACMHVCVCVCAEMTHVLTLDLKSHQVSQETAYTNLSPMACAE